SGCKLWKVGSWEPGPPVDGGYPAFSHDGKVVAVEVGLGTIRLLDPETGRKYAELEDPNHERASVLSFTPDGTRLIAESLDSPAIHVWDLSLIRQQLRELDLDWEAPPLPPTPKSTPSCPQAVVIMGDASRPSLFSLHGAKQLIAQKLEAWKERPNN